MNQLSQDPPSSSRGRAGALPSSSKPIKTVESDEEEGTIPIPAFQEWWSLNDPGTGSLRGCVQLLGVILLAHLRGLVIYIRFLVGIMAG